ncbi:MAG: TetR/AcrR family transcriptional regulator [Cellvibrio sp.]|uniref:TetR/AcrR family transcriptional regulator n=1 Tax=Cellvibrio sp. TaxID=1965322 RepID=UPI0031B37F04
MTTATNQTDPLLLQLAVALANQPRANLQELAKAVGVSKATLYRFCPTREEIIARLLEEATITVALSLEACDLEHAPVEVAFKSLIASVLDSKELTLFLIYHFRPDFLLETNLDKRWLEIQKVSDKFFLRCQHEGLLRIDISAVALSEIFFGIGCSLIEAEHRGRVPRAGMAELIEKMFLQGAGVQQKA